MLTSMIGVVGEHDIGRLSLMRRGICHMGPVPCRASGCCLRVRGKATSSPDRRGAPIALSPGRRSTVPMAMPPCSSHRDARVGIASSSITSGPLNFGSVASCHGSAPSSGSSDIGFVAVSIGNPGWRQRYARFTVACSAGCHRAFDQDPSLGSRPSSRQARPRERDSSGAVAPEPGAIACEEDPVLIDTPEWPSSLPPFAVPLPEGTTGGTAEIRPMISHRAKMTRKRPRRAV